MGPCPRSGRSRIISHACSQMISLADNDVVIRVAEWFCTSIPSQSGIRLSMTQKHRSPTNAVLTCQAPHLRPVRPVKASTPVAANSPSQVPRVPLAMATVHQSTSRIKAGTV
ncbi:hypothetical protein D3C78_1683610 [compost metagenome]